MEGYFLKARHINPYSGRHLTSVNTCGFFFPCTETGLQSDGYITDTVSGLQYQPSHEGNGGTIANVSGLTSAVGISGTGATCHLMTGSWPNFGTKSIINFAVCRIVDNANLKIPIGNGSGTPANDHLVTVSWTSGMHTIVADGTTTVKINNDTNRVLPANGTDAIIVVEYTPGVVLTAKAMDLSGNTFGAGITETVLTTTPAALGEINPGVNNYSRISGLALYGWAAFSFTGGLPADRATAYKWMAAEWASRGNRYLWPAWASLT